MFKKGVNNIIIGLASQVIIMLLGIVVPRFVLVNYGSDINGLFNSVSQVYSYMALLEAGVGASTLQYLYRYIGSGEKSTISSIISAAHNFYKKISAIYFVFVILFGLIFAFTANSSIDRIYILLIFWIQGIAGIINFRFVAAEKILLTAEGKSYVTNSITTIFSIVTSICKIILVNLQINIVLLQTVYCLINLTQLLVYFIYFKRKYSWINLKAIPDKNSLKEKNEFLVIEIAWTVFSCSDMVILSFLCDFKIVSVYAIYNLVFSSISTLLNACYNGTQFALSRTFHENIERYKKYHDCYESVFLFLIFILMSICYIMILPFVSLYTQGISDISYIDPLLPLLFCSVQILTWCRYVPGNLCNISGKAKRISKISLIEMLIKLITSVILTYFLGIYGVLLGTIIALLFKSNYLIIYANKSVLKRSPVTAYKTIIINSLLFVLTIIVQKRLTVNITNYFDLIIMAVVVSVAVIVIYSIINLIINYNSYSYMIKLLTLKIKSKLLAIKGK